MQSALLTTTNLTSFPEPIYCKDDFYESFIKAIGLPVSKTIRHNSVERSKERVRAKDLKIIEQAEQILERGYLAESHKLTILRKLVRLKDCDYVVGAKRRHHK